MKIIYSDALTMDYIAGELRRFAQALRDQGCENYAANHPLSFEHDIKEVDFAQAWLNDLVNRLKEEARKEDRSPWWQVRRLE